jgi:hypothetical protein
MTVQNVCEQWHSAIRTESGLDNNRSNSRMAPSSVLHFVFGNPDGDGIVMSTEKPHGDMEMAAWRDSVIKETGLSFMVPLSGLARKYTAQTQAQVQRSDLRMY